MSNAMKVYVFLWVVSMYGHTPAAAEDFSALELDVRQFVKQKKLPAFSIQLVGADGPIWSAGFSSEDNSATQKIDRHTVYRVGSISKLFTDMALMQLVEEDLVDLNAPVSRYLPSFAPKNPFGTEVTVEALMSHRSGLVREPPVGNYFDASEPSIKAVVDSLNDTALVYEPGTKVQYSNAAVTVVGRIIEVLRGKPFNQVIQERFLGPLAMEGSFEQSENLNSRMPGGYMRPYHDRHFPAPNFTLGISPAGNLYASMDDLGKFVQALLHMGQGHNGRILQAQTLRQMWTPVGDVKSARSRQFGIGFALEEFEGEMSVGHGGAIYGFSSQLKVLPNRKLGVVASANLDFANGAVDRIADHALRYALALQKGLPVPEFELSRSVDAKTIVALKGSYRSEEGHSLTIRERHGELFLERIGGLTMQLMQADAGVIVDGLLVHNDSVKITPEKVEAFGVTYHREPLAKPDADITALMPFFGEYGEDHNVLYISEKGGKLHALIEWGTEYPLEKIDENLFQFPGYGLYPNETLRFRRSENGQVTMADLGGILFLRRETVGVSDGVFLISPNRPVSELVAEALQASPPEEDGEFRQSDLVDVSKFAENIKLDIRYASDNNFLGTPVYSQPKAFLQREAAQALGRVSKRLGIMGYGLLIHDAYRPWYVSKVFWDATPEDKKIFVANPMNGSRHNRGSAVDLTLYDLKTGKPVDMVGVYDEMSERSYPHYPGGSSLQRWRRDLLINEMTAGGFTVYEYEWWHFDFNGWQSYPLGNKTFEALEDNE